MKATVIVDNIGNIYPGEWGLCIYIENNGKNILLDAGSSNLFIDNAKKLAEQIAKDEKLENLALWYKDLIAEANALKEEKEAFAAREKAAKNKAESIKNYLSYALNGENFKTTRCVLSFRKSEKTVIDDIYSIPEIYLKYAEPKADLTEIKKAIKNGEEIKGAHLEEAQNIQIK